MKLISSKPKALSLAIAGAVTMSLFGTSGAYAQRAIEEVVITAERREATEQTTSISMEVFTQDDLTSNGITELQDLQDAMPGIQVQNNGIANEINIRGVGSSVYSPQVQMGVQVVNDGLVHGEPMGLNGAFFDVGTVEVLRGPQGTFIGQSAAGGAILVNSVNPDFDGIHGFVEGKMGNYQHNDVSAAINLPISNTWAARLAVKTEERGSYYQNLGGQIHAFGEEQTRPGSLDNRQIRLSLLWEPTQQFSAIFKVEQNRVDNWGGVRKPKRLPTTGTTIGDHDGNPATPDQPFEVTTYSQFREYSPAEPYQLYKQQPGFNWQQNQQWSMRLSYEMANGLMINTNTGYNRLYVLEDYRDGNNDANSRVPIWTDRFQLGPDNRSVSNEITLSTPEDGRRASWIVGAFSQQRYSPVHIHAPRGQDNDSCGWGADGIHDPCGDLQDPTHYDNILSPASVNNDAIFGQFDYQITDELEFALGLRWNMDQSDRQTTIVRYQNNPTNDPALGTSALCDHYGIQAPLRQSVNQFGDPSTWTCMVTRNTVVDTNDLDVDTDVPTYKIGLNWAPTDTDYFYAFYARGYKAATSQGDGVRPEQIDDYEFGWKGTMFDGALSGDLGFYYMDYTDMQQTAFVVADPVGADIQATNIGDSEIMGIEGSFQTFIGNLGINGSFSFASSEVKEARTVNENLLPDWALHPEAVEGLDYLPQCGVGGSTESTGLTAGGDPNGDCFNYDPYFTVFSGQDQITAPDVSYNLSVDYALPWAGGTLTPRISFSHTDENYASLIQTPYYRNEARDLTNLSLTYDYEDWTVQAYINNVSDETYIATARADLLGYGDPRTYGIRARLNF